MAGGSNDRTMIRQRSEPSEAFLRIERAYVDLADERLGAIVVAASDEWYAPASRMLNPKAANYYYHDDEGMRWVDGWETSRRRKDGNEWCVIKLGRPGQITAVGFDTSFYTGNYPLAASVQACAVSADDDIADAEWTELVPATELAGDSQRLVSVNAERVFTHVRLNIFPDGGMARFRVFGLIQLPEAFKSAGQRDLAALESGARVVGCSDTHFGAVRAMIAPGPSVEWGKGWETRRLRKPGHDWAVIALAAPGTLERVLVDTTYYTGNFPAAFSLQGACLENGLDEVVLNQAMYWPELVGCTDLKGGCQNAVELGAVHRDTLVTHVRLNIYPDGGVTRLRLLGTPALRAR
ncbi:allantoicase [Cupriavidus oxalaticus]